jgi:hypothetical protein
MSNVEPRSVARWLCSFLDETTQLKGKNMSRTARTIVISAAMAGLLAGTMGTTGCSSSKDDSAAAGASTNSAATDKHDCKGLNSCKGKGGCSQGDQGCKGKNSCKGKGGCKSA